MQHTLSAQTDTALISLYTKQGDTKALGIVLSRCKEKMFTSIHLMVKDKYLAEDILQDVFIRIIDALKRGKYTEDDKFLPWATRIAHNMCINYFRKVKRSPKIKTSDDRDIFEVLDLFEPSTEERMVRRENHQEVREMIDILPEKQREVIILHHYADQRFKDIAIVTNCSIHTAVGRMRYGLINLRKMMDVPARQAV